VINSIGIAKFENAYAYGESQKSFRFLGKDVQVNGQVSFNLLYSDVFSYAKNTSLDGDILIIPPIYQNKEFQSLENLFSFSFLPYTVIIGFVFVLVSILLQKKFKIISS